MQSQVQHEHLEQTPLLQPEVVTMESLKDFAEERTRHDPNHAEDFHQRVEISPRHHQQHLEIARFVPDLESLPTDQQDVIGETIEIAEEAIGNEEGGIEQTEEFAELEDGIHPIENGYVIKLSGDEDGAIPNFFYMQNFRYQEPAIADHLGYRFQEEEIPYSEIEKTGEWQIHHVAFVPDIEQLNAKKSEVPAEVGVNTGTFVAHEGGHIDMRDYVKYFANGQIPVATNPEDTKHDLLTHGLGFSIMSEDMFSHIVDLSKRAVETNDDELASRITMLVDTISGRLTTDPNNKLGVSERNYVDFFSLSMSPEDATIKAKESLEIQQRVNNSLRELVTTTS